MKPLFQDPVLLVQTVPTGAVFFVYNMCIQHKTPMPAKSDLTTTQLTSYLSENFGSDINADHIRSACDHFGVTYPTAVKRIRDYNVGRGKWNLTVQEKLEQTYQAPAAAPIRVTVEDCNLIPDKDDTFVPVR